MVKFRDILVILKAVRNHPDTANNLTIASYTRQLSAYTSPTVQR